MGDQERGLLLIGESHNNADMYKAIGFLFGDPVIYLRSGGEQVLVCSNFERAEAQRHSRVPEVLSFQDLGFSELLQQFPKRYMAFAEMVLRLIRQRGVTALTVNDLTPVHVVDHLRANGVDVVCDPEVMLPERIAKQPEEIAAIEAAQRAAERAMDRAIGLIAASEPRDGLLVLDGAPFTSERLRLAIDLVFLEEECVAEGTIAACGADAASPHNRGAGPLRPNQSIVLDLFPRHTVRRYYADMTRTVSKGDPGPEIRRMYETTLRAHETALSMIAPGVNGREVYEAVCRLYEEAGYPTSLRTGRYPETGFIHSLGHGVGLEVHEGPRLGTVDETLQEGHVVTVEPGLYDPKVGGVRIEDFVVVTAHGCRNLTRFAKQLVV
jgi:Xaa-Pro aminopeptidase